MIRPALRWTARGLAAVMLTLIRGYQLFIRPLTPPLCIYEPGCSEYTCQAIKLYGPLKGGYKGARRIMRCHPFAKGGYDPP